jgi:flagella basal body P-ring formation protein FlgA
MNRITLTMHRPVFLSRALPTVLLLTAAALVGLGTAAPAAEFQLRTQCQARGALVRLGDLADVYDSNRQTAEKLAALELFPAPPAGQPRFVQVREIQDFLLLRGVNLVEHRFSGSSQVVVTRSTGLLGSTGGRLQLLLAGEMKKASQRIRDALLQYMQQNAPTRDMPDVEFTLTDDQARTVAKAEQNPVLRGGTPPWSGTQQFLVSVAAAEGPVRFPLGVQMTRCPVVAVAAHGLPRGTVIRPEDVLLASNVPQNEQGGAFRSADELIGRETTRSVLEGRPIDRDSVRSPLLVRRGEVVTVYARSAGIRIRTVARARDDGAQGELVALEAIQDRKVFFARVCGVQEVEIYARAVQSEEGNATAGSPIMRR